MELQPPLYFDVVEIEKGAFWSSSTKVAKFTFFKLLDAIHQRSTIVFLEFWETVSGS